MTGLSLRSLITVVQHLPTAVVLIDPPGCVVGASAPAVDLIGALPEQDGPALDEHLARLAARPAELGRTTIETADGAHTLVALEGRGVSLPSDDVAILAGAVAHEFNNLLGVIINFTTLAAADASPGSQTSRDLSEVLGASRRAAEISRSLMQLGDRRSCDAESPA